jgi:hypothetical protein
MKVYKQMKMYNDDELNPVCTKEKNNWELNICQQHKAYSRHETFRNRCRMTVPVLRALYSIQR